MCFGKLNCKKQLVHSPDGKAREVEYSTVNAISMANLLPIHSGRTLKFRLLANYLLHAVDRNTAAGFEPMQ